MKKTILLGLLLILLIGCTQTQIHEQTNNQTNNNNTINNENNNTNIDSNSNKTDLNQNNASETNSNKSTNQNETDSNNINPNQNTTETDFNTTDFDSNSNNENNEEEYNGALPDLTINTLLLNGNFYAGDEKAEFLLVVKNFSPTPISLNEHSITVKLIDLDSNQEIASFKDGPYIELTRFLGNTKFSYALTTIKNPKILETPGEKNILAIVDAENQVKEKNELNNEKQFTIKIKAKNN